MYLILIFSLILLCGNIRTSVSSLIFLTREFKFLRTIETAVAYIVASRDDSPIIRRNLLGVLTFEKELQRALSAMLMQNRQPLWSDISNRLDSFSPTVTRPTLRAIFLQARGSIKAAINIVPDGVAYYIVKNCDRVVPCWALSFFFLLQSLYELLVLRNVL